MKIDCISDLHGHYPKLEGGDLLIIAGDLTSSDTHLQYQKFFEWLKIQRYNKKIFISGNHDNKLTDFYCTSEELKSFEYLCDSGTEFEGLKIWGTPWTKTFEGMNPKCKAFTVDTEEELASKFSLIPGDVDILITHSPPHGIFDMTCKGEFVGSPSLLEKVCEIKPLLHIFGHVHEEGGRVAWIPWSDPGTRYINCSLVNEKYEPVNKPIRVII